MKTIIIVFISLIALSSCKKDEPLDPCEGITCINGGTCINGECDCPTGYEGPDCGRETLPNSVFITNVKVLRFPATDENGAGWDLFDGADIYVSIAKGNDKIYGPNDNYINADPTKSYNFNFGYNCELKEPLDLHNIILFDFDDFSADDFMGGSFFLPYIDGNKFPSTITLDAGGKVAFEITLEYRFN